MDCLLLKCMPDTFPERHFQLEETGFCHLQEEIIDSRSDQFLAFNNNDCFFCYQRKFSNTVTSEILCIGRESQRSISGPSQKCDLLSFSEAMRSEKSFTLLSWCAKPQQFAFFDSVEMNSKVKFLSKCPMCFPIIGLLWLPSLNLQCIWRGSECVETIHYYLYFPKPDSAPQKRKQEFTWKGQQRYLELSLYAFAQIPLKN